MTIEPVAVPCPPGAHLPDFKASTFDGSLFLSTCTRCGHQLVRGNGVWLGPH